MRHYQHTQIGWVILWIGGGSTLVVIVAMVLSGATPLALWLLPLLLAPVLFFGSLTVTVTDDDLEARFGPGPIKVRVPLASVRSCQRVRNEWFYGFGIRFIPGGRLYNVSGYEAVELTCHSGRTVRIGTDDPDALLASLQQTVGRGAITTDDSSGAWAATPIVAALVLVSVVLVGIGGIIYTGKQPVDVVVSDQQITVRGAFYSDIIRAADIVDVSLDPVLPSIARKTNGFNAGQTLRGSFRLRDGRSARLFVERSSPPFVQVRTATNLVFINYTDPSDTRTLYEQIRHLHDGP